MNAATPHSGAKEHELPHGKMARQNEDKKSIWTSLEKSVQRCKSKRGKWGQLVFGFVFVMFLMDSFVEP